MSNEPFELIQEVYSMTEKKYVRPEGRAAQRKAGNVSANEGDRGGTETTVTFSEWAALVGYNPETGLYDLEPIDIHPPPVVSSLNPPKRFTKEQHAKQAEIAEDSSEDKFTWRSEYTTIAYEPGGPDERLRRYNPWPD